jgi:hypothetical protein
MPICLVTFTHEVFGSNPTFLITISFSLTERNFLFYFSFITDHYQPVINETVHQENRFFLLMDAHAE